MIPSNTLAIIYGLALDCANRKVLGNDVDIVIDAYHEPNTVIPIQKIFGIRNTLMEGWSGS